MNEDDVAELAFLITRAMMDDMRFLGIKVSAGEYRLLLRWHGIVCDAINGYRRENPEQRQVDGQSG